MIMGRFLQLIVIIIRIIVCICIFWAELKLEITDLIFFAEAIEGARPEEILVCREIIQ